MSKVLNIHQRLAAVMGEVDYIQKEKKSGMNYTIVSHDAVTAKVRPVLLKNGIVYYPVRCEHSHNGNRAECSMTVRFVNIDEPTDYFDVPTFGYGIDPQDKGPGKAMSYAVKYALLKALGLETGDDPDNDSIAYSPPQPKEERNEAVESLYAELCAITSLRGLASFKQDNGATIGKMSAVDRKRFISKRDELEAKFSKAKDTAQDIADTFGGNVVDERIRDVEGRYLENMEG